MSDDQRYQRAKKKLEAIKGFYVHAGVFILVMSILFIVNLTVSKVWWVQWPLLGWGAGLAAHYALVFTPALSWGADWEKRKLKELMKDQ